MNQADPLDTPAQLAERLGVSERTLETWRYKRIGPRYIPVGRHVRYRRSDVDKWLKEQQASVPA